MFMMGDREVLRKCNFHFARERKQGSGNDRGSDWIPLSSSSNLMVGRPGSKVAKTYETAARQR